MTPDQILSGLRSKLHSQDADRWYGTTADSLNHYLSGASNKNIADYLATIEKLLMRPIEKASLNQHLITLNGHADQDAIETGLKALRPWRKGPFSIFDVYIDAEWQSDLKWDRIAPLLGDVTGKRILDVGCGNGYHALRLAGIGAGLVLGVDSATLSIAQFLLLTGWLQVPVWIAPARIETMPAQGHFDGVLSMGVLSHQRNPQKHLQTLRSKLLPGGLLILETLIIEQQDGLIPEDRYARMRNIWQLPSSSVLTRWLDEAGYKDIIFVRSDRTLPSEQRTTEWMPFESLAESLDERDNNLTVEGYPAPLRGIFRAYR